MVLGRPVLCRVLIVTQPKLAFHSELPFFATVAGGHPQSLCEHASEWPLGGHGSSVELPGGDQGPAGASGKNLAPVAGGVGVGGGADSGDSGPGDPNRASTSNQGRHIHQPALVQIREKVEHSKAVQLRVLQYGFVGDLHSHSLFMFSGPCDALLWVRSIRVCF